MLLMVSALGRCREESECDATVPRLDLAHVRGGGDEEEWRSSGEGSDRAVAVAHERQDALRPDHGYVQKARVLDRFSEDRYWCSGNAACGQSFNIKVLRRQGATEYY
jgi:hypothetical protein